VKRARCRKFFITDTMRCLRGPASSGRARFIHAAGPGWHSRNPNGAQLRRDVYGTYASGQVRGSMELISDSIRAVVVGGEPARILWKRCKNGRWRGVDSFSDCGGNYFAPISTSSVTRAVDLCRHDGRHEIGDRLGLLMRKGR